jgi:hypothetical protein
MWILLVSISARQRIRRTAVNELLPSLYAQSGRKGLAGALRGKRMIINCHAHYTTALREPLEKAELNWID